MPRVALEGDFLSSDVLSQQPSQPWSRELALRVCSQGCVPPVCEVSEAGIFHEHVHAGWETRLPVTVLSVAAHTPPFPLVDPQLVMLRAGPERDSPDRFPGL